jgi:hypothetical protein
MADSQTLTQSHRGQDTIKKNNPLKKESIIVKILKEAVFDFISKMLAIDPNLKFEYIGGTSEKKLNKTEWAEKNNKIKIKNKYTTEDDAQYADYEKKFKEDSWKRTGTVPNKFLIEKFTKAGYLCYPQGRDTYTAGPSPDGGVLYVQIKDGTWVIVFVSEVKHQNDNPGNALERLLTNVSGFSCYCDEDIFPFLTVCVGSIVCPERGSYVDRLTRSRGFFPLNEANVYSVNKINKWADTRPFSMIWDQDQTKNEFKSEIDGLKAEIKKIDDQINEAKAEEDKTKLLAEQDVLKVRLNELESDYSTDFKKKIYNIATEIMTAMIGELKRVNKL